MEQRKQKLLIGLDLSMTLLCLLLLWGCEALGAGGAAMLPFVLLPLCALTAERRWVGYPIAVLGTAALILFLPFIHIAWFGFVAVLSWYAPVRRLLDRKLSVVKGGLLALGLCNAGVLLGLFGLSLLGAHPLGEIDPLGIVLIAFGAEIGFLLLDVAYQLFTRLWTLHLRRAVLV